MEGDPLQVDGGKKRRTLWSSHQSSRLLASQSRWIESLILSLSALGLDTKHQTASVCGARKELSWDVLKCQFVRFGSKTTAINTHFYILLLSTVTLFPVSLIFLKAVFIRDSLSSQHSFCSTSFRKFRTVSVHIVHIFWDPCDFLFHVLLSYINGLRALTERSSFNKS